MIRKLELGMLTGLALLAGCGEKPKVVEAVDPSEVRDRDRSDTAAPRRTPARDRYAKVTPPPPRETSTDPEEQASAAPTPAPEPKPVITTADQFTLKDNGAPDEGGWRLDGNGVIEAEPVVVETTMTRFSMEAKGSPAQDIWPEVVVQYDPIGGQGYAARTWPNQFITTGTYHLYERDLEDYPVIPGTYKVTFRYTNNQEFPEENRSAAVRWLRLDP